MATVNSNGVPQMEPFKWNLSIGEEPPISGSELSPAGYVGSMQQILQQNTGNYVVCDFLIGTQTVVRKEGILYAVGVSFMVLYEVIQRRYIICDFYSLKFTTFYEPGTEPYTLSDVDIPAPPQVIK